jgi:hypothetical protein
MRHDASAVDPHAGHAMPMPATDSVKKLADSLSRADSYQAAREPFVNALFRLLEDPAVLRRVVGDSALRRVLLDLAPLMPQEHRSHYEAMLRPPPARPEGRSLP